MLNPLGRAVFLKIRKSSTKIYRRTESVWGGPQNGEASERQGWGPDYTSRGATAHHNINPSWAKLPTGSGAPRGWCSRTDVLSVLESAQKRVFVRTERTFLRSPRKRTVEVRLPKVNVLHCTISQAPQAPRKLVSDSAPMFSFWVR